MENTINKYLEMAASAKIGWWEADLVTRCFSISDYLGKVLHIQDNTISFEDYAELIRSDYRQVIIDEMRKTGMRNNFIYVRSYPLIISENEIWVHSFVSSHGVNEEGHASIFGVIQQVDSPEFVGGTDSHSESVSTMLQRLNTISQTLFDFLREENENVSVVAILRNLLNYFNADRTYIFENTENGLYQDNTYEVTKGGVTTQKENLQRVLISSIPWWSGRILNGEPIILDDVEEIKDSAPTEYEMLVGQGIKSVLVVPLFGGKEVWGYMGIDIVANHRHWCDTDYQWFSSMANIVSICIELSRARSSITYEQKFLRNLFAHMPLGYLHMVSVRDNDGNISDFRVIDTNDVFNELLAFPKGFVVGHTVHDVYASEEAERRIDFIKEVVRGKKNFNEEDELHPRSKKYFRKIAYSPEKDHAVLLYLDVTATRFAEKARLHSESLFHNIFEDIPVGVEIYDRNGYLTDINTKDMEVFGIERKEDALGVSLKVDPNYSDDVKRRFWTENLVEFYCDYDFDKVNFYHHSNAHQKISLLIKCHRLLDADGNISGFILIALDNVEKVEAMSKVRDFENFFSIISDYAHIGYAKMNILTKEGYAIKQWNRNLGEDEDKPLSGIVGIYSKLHPDDRESMIEFLKKAKDGTATDIHCEVRVDNGNGGWNWIHKNVVVTRYAPDEGEIELIGVNYDITDLKQIEAELIAARNKAETMDRLKSAFLANMSHEIRTPLNAIVGFSDLLADSDDPDERHEYMNIIRTNNELLLQLISDILDLSKIEAGTFDFTMGDLDVNMLCDDIVKSSRLKAKEGVKIIFDHHIKNCRIFSDRNRLSQVITNFVNNAVKFTSEGYIKVGYDIICNKIRFYVSDSGVGIDKEQQAKIFERFVKLNAFVQGTGLGLSICQSIVKQLGGEIGVDSEVGKGSTFWFTLPYSEIKSKNIESVANVAEPIEDSSVKFESKPIVLVAEDTESNYLLVSTILKKSYQVEWAHDGLEAVALFQRIHPDIVLMDIRMPRMNGHEATREIRRIDKNVPIVASTAFAFEEDKRDALEAGCNGFIAKPVNAYTLRSEIAKFLKKSSD
jgi:signal transduction histidine kinase/ActR/RegA family two-component response regulator